MGLIGFLLPFIIVIALVGLVGYSINRVGIKGNKYINSKRMYWLLGGYVIFLLLATALFFTIPIHSNTNQVEEIDFGNSFSLEYMIPEELLDGASAYIVSEDEFPYEKGELILQLINTDDEYYGVYQVLVEKKELADQIIEVVVYQTPTYINGWDITEYIDPIQVDLSSNALLINSVRREFSYASFKTEFPFTQFEEDHEPWFTESIVTGQQLLFLRVPKDLELISDEDVEIIYLNE